MAYPDYDDPPPYVNRRRARQDLAAVLMVVLGLTGLVVCAYMWDPLAGAAAFSAVLVALGAAFAYDRG